MAKHPFADAFKCDKFVAGVPCLCPAWQEFTHQKPAGVDGGGVEVVKGCMFQLFVPIMGWAINAAHGADATHGAIRNDIQQGFERLAQGSFALVAAIQAPKVIGQGGPE